MKASAEGEDAKALGFKAVGERGPDYRFSPSPATTASSTSVGLLEVFLNRQPF